MNRQAFNNAKKHLFSVTIRHGIAETRTGIRIVVLKQISIEILTCCRTVVWQCGFVSAVKQASNLINQ